MENFKRMTIDQPSKIQNYYNLHNRHVLALITEENQVKIYFMEGVVISQLISKNALIEGWR